MTLSAVGLRSERGPVLLAVMLSTGLVAIDSTILATAVPTIVADVGGFEAFPWLFSVYLLTQAVAMPIYSKLSDTFGRKPMLLIGIGLFLLGSVLCGVGWDMLSLIIFRAVQGLGAAAILPIGMTVIGDIYSPEERARVQGYLASVWAVAAVVGPTLGGIFAEFLHWRWIFWINLPLCVAAGWLLWRAFHERIERRVHKIDYAGSVLLAAALTLLLLGLLEGGVAWDWASPLGIGVFVAGALAFLAFVLVERRAAEPVLPLWVLSRRLLLTTSAATLVVGVVLSGLTTFVPTYLEGSLGVSPLVGGLTLAALTIGWPLSGGFAGRFYLRIGFRATMTIGALTAIVSSALLALTAATPSILLAGVACFGTGLGFGLLAGPGLVVAQSSVPWGERGVVTGANMFFRTIGSTVGVAVLGAIANGVLASRGGDETDPATATAMGAAVFAATAIVSVGTLIAVRAMPRGSSTPTAPDDAVAPA